MKFLFLIFSCIVLFISPNKQAIGQSDTVTTLTLSTCIKAALDYSPNIKEGFIQTEIKNTEISMARSLQYPYLLSNADYNLTNQNKLDDNYNSVSYGINANQVLWQYGKNKALAEQSNFLYKAEISSYNALQQDMVVLIKSFYFEYLKYNRLLEIAKNNLEQADLFLTAAKEKKAIGTGKNSDILKAESDVAEAKYIYSTYANSALKSRNELMSLTGLIITNETQVQDNLDSLNNRFLNVRTDSLFSIAKSNYPELNIIENMLLSQDAYTKSVKAEVFPKIIAGAGYNMYYNPLFKSNGFWNAGLTISWDIFSGYSKRYQLKIEKLQSNAINCQKEDMMLKLSKEISNLSLIFNESYSQIGIIETLLKSTTENLNMVLEEYKQGISSMLELTNARMENFNAKGKYIDAWYAYQISKVQLERMLGVINK